MRDIIRATSCTDAWLQATHHLRQQDDWRDYNVVLEISRPIGLAVHEKGVSAEVNRFLVSHGKHSISTVINTVFPASFYVKHGKDELFKRYTEITPKLSNHEDTKWGTYFMRMAARTDPHGKEVRPLEYLIAKLSRQVKVVAPKQAVYEVSLLDPFLDIPVYDPGTDKGYHMGGPCLSHLSFKLKKGKSLLLTAIYRSHYYIERALANFYGLALLQDFVAREAGIETAELICHSTMAVLDAEGVKNTEVSKMLDTCMQIRESSENQKEKRSH